MARKFVRDVDGAEHPVDYEIEVPHYVEKVVEYDEPVTEQYVLSFEEHGTLDLACRNLVTFVED